MTHPYLEFVFFGVVTASLLQMIPSIAALLAVFWYAILIWESRTVRKMTDRLDDIDAQEPHNPDDMMGM